MLFRSELAHPQAETLELRVQVRKQGRVDAREMIAARTVQREHVCPVHSAEINEAKRRADNPQAFGTGSIYGVAAPEAANNAVVGGALIPTITLGIPGSSATAVLMGGLMIHGIMPGPTLMIEHADVTYTLLWAVLLSNFVMFLEGVVFTRLCVCVTRVSNRVLAVAVADRKSVV